MSRTSRHCSWLFVGILWLGMTAAAFGQARDNPRPAPGSGDQAPVLVSISPPGATLGKVTEWTVSGRNLAGIRQWLVSGSDVEIVEALPSTENQATLRVKVSAAAEPGYREIRAVGPAGTSNLAVVRIDALDQIAETEPNDLPDKASPVAIGAAAWGVLKAQDIDYFQIEGKAGACVTIDLEAQRLGTPFVPIVTVSTKSGTAIGQARESRGIDRDARLSLIFPSDGIYLIQVRDNLYAGGDSAVYRLRIKDEPFATALFPLGGPPGASVVVTASGGNLSQARSKTIALPKTPGVLIDPGPFDGPGGAILSPMKLLVGGESQGLNASGFFWPLEVFTGESVEVIESAPDANGQSTTMLPFNAIANGRIDRPGEVDRYKVAVKKGDTLNVRIRASDMGSWLDSVLTLRDASGAVLVENDDPGDSAPQRSPFVVNQTQTPPDSRVVYEARGDGEIVIEVADRFNEGGPAYGYRLEAGAARPDFAISLLFNDPNANRRNGMVMVQTGRPARPSGPGVTGAFNLRPGSSIPINFLVTSEGRTGPIEVRAEGLPPGVSSTVQTIRAATAVGRNPNNRAAAPSGGNIVLKVDADAPASLGEFRIVATAKPENGPPITRTASAAVAIDTPLSGNVTGRPIMRTLTSLPVQVLGDNIANAATLAPKNAATMEPLNFTLRSITVPGVLLQGDRIDLILETDPPNLLPRGGNLEVSVAGGGVVFQTVVMDASSAASAGPAVARLVAAVDAAPGVREITLTLNPPGGAPPIIQKASVIVRTPVTVRPRDERIEIVAGKPTFLSVGIVREPGFDGSVEIRLDLPEGVTTMGRTVIPANASVGEFALKVTRDLPAMAEARITAVVRSPRGPVRVESPLRPLFVTLPAEKKEGP